MTVSEQIIQIIDSLCEKFGIAINWTNENVIPYLEVLCGKLIIYEISTSIALIVIMTSFSIAGIILTKKFVPTFKEGLKNQSSWDMGWTVGTVFAIIGLVILHLSTIIVVGVQIMDIIKCLTFPEMYIFEYISRLIQS